MKDEIKEKMTIGKAKKILRGFLAKDCYYDTPLYYAIPYLLDYITNLQQENERLNHQLEVQKELTERNRLRKHCYKSRIEKAVEYMKKSKKISLDDIMSIINFYNNLLEILNGRSDE